MTNLRFGGYLLVALGLINMRYQTGHNSVVLHSLSIIVPGAFLLLATFLQPTKKFLEQKNNKVIVGIIVLLLVGYSFIN
ncbi:MAG: hypothetical protein WCO27_03215 [Actinomycetes bacterium]|jgi:uncharacterized membrane protein YjjP (DUF1212 family)|uniref:Unannotated protein n=1 Tax=freshwater metagenome TaxID=449393 RepID=A0A6J7FYD7_9ZZZZ|nr:hypothetical protein [Actinomycetota bacterium]MSW08750.1 hypothetical protein [Actinomycetota bacterium]MSW23235.1 hypothetical protein [Actinomycetota bacterium]MSW75292.1 hypothetical protein [Actinomycetota bacterium]MSY30350.1 hypothetical protein [Actinomycetota bacterium]